MTSGKQASTLLRQRSIKIVVIVAISGAVVFGIYIGYLALSNDSFPAQQKPFGSYAVVTSDTFNGTEFAFNLKWLNSSALPMYAQLNSLATDAGNTDVCTIGLQSVSSGQTIFLPFNISPTSATLQNVDLSIAVHPLQGGSDFTIVYNVPSISASNALISPSNISCSQPQGGNEGLVPVVHLPTFFEQSSPFERCDGEGVPREQAGVGHGIPGWFV